MSRAEPEPLNIRSRFARERVASIARRTGMTMTQIVEEALRGYDPPSAAGPQPGLIRKGAILIRPSDNERVSLADADAALEKVRLERD